MRCAIPASGASLPITAMAAPCSSDEESIATFKGSIEVMIATLKIAAVLVAFTKAYR